jgi:hypothetical protein
MLPKTYWWFSHLPEALLPKLNQTRGDCLHVQGLRRKRTIPTLRMEDLPVLAGTCTRISLVWVMSHAEKYDSPDV